MQIQSSYKVHLNTIRNGELSDPLCDSVNRGLTLARLELPLQICNKDNVFNVYKAGVHTCTFGGMRRQGVILEIVYISSYLPIFYFILGICLILICVLLIVLILSQVRGLASKRKVECSNPSRDSPRSLKQVVTTPLPNARDKV